MLAPMSGKAKPSHQAKSTQSFADKIRREFSLLIGLGTVAIFWGTGSRLVEIIAHPITLVAVFLWLFAVILWSAVSVARHADCLAIKWGEPYGTLVLTLSAITIEVVMVSTAMLHGENNPALGRDAIFSVMMISRYEFMPFTLLNCSRWRNQPISRERPTNPLRAIIMTLA